MTDHITTVQLFLDIEALRTQINEAAMQPFKDPDAPDLEYMTIEAIAALIGVSSLSYKSWKNHGVVPRASLEPRLKQALAQLRTLWSEYACPVVTTESVSLKDVLRSFDELD